MKFSQDNFKITPSGDVTILVNSCDAYKDVQLLFFEAMKEYWPDVPYKIILNSESSNLLNYSAKEKIEKPWGARLIDILNNIKSKYIIMLFDDFILEEKVDQYKIISALNILEKENNSSVFYLNAACLRDHEDDPLSDYRILKDSADYRLNSVPSVWKKKDLLKYTRKFDNPWTWEIFGSFRTFNKNRFYSTSSKKKDIFKYNSKKGGAIYRGKWVKEVVEDKIKKYKLNIDLNERGIIDQSEIVNRSFLWKIKFIILGFKSIGLKMFIFLFRYLKIKIS
jgi:hypothetical protein